MSEALKVLVGPDAAGLSATTVSRLKQRWADEYRCWMQQRLDDARWVYIWADGIYSGLRAENAKLCALVVIGVNERGQKHFLAIEDGVRESTQSWREVLLKRKARGLDAPELGIGDGAMGLWAALEEVFPTTRQQRYWVQDGQRVEPLPQIRSAKSQTSATRSLAGSLSRQGMLYMIFKLGQCAEKKGYRLRGFDDLAKVIKGVPFKDGIEVTKFNQTAA